MHKENKITLHTYKNYDNMSIGTGHFDTKDKANKRLILNNTLMLNVIFYKGS